MARRQTHIRQTTALTPDNAIGDAGRELLALMNQGGALLVSQSVAMTALFAEIAEEPLFRQSA